MSCYLVKKKGIQIGIISSMLLLLSACSGDQRALRQANGNDDYLKANQLRELKIPEGMILPIQNGAYDVPYISQTGAVGKAVDIRPPVQMSTTPAAEVSTP